MKKSPIRRWLRTALIATLGLATETAVWGGSDKPAPLLRAGRCAGAVDAIARFTHRASDIVSPGNTIGAALNSLTCFSPLTDTLLSQYVFLGVPRPSTSYMRRRGTRMAAPLVRAAATLLIQQNPALTSCQVDAGVMRAASRTVPTTSSCTDPKTGITFNRQYEIFTIGTVNLNAAAALSSGDPSPSGDPSASGVNAQSPAVALTAGKTIAATLVNSTKAICGYNVVRGGLNRFLTAGNVVGGPQIPAAAKVVRGSASPDSAAVILTEGGQ